MKKLKKKIMKELDLDCQLHDIKIIYRAPHAVFSNRIVFTHIEIKGDKHVKIMFDRINSTPQLKVAELYISVEPHIEVGSEDVQQTNLEGGGREEFQSLHADSHLTLTPCTTVGGYQNLKGFDFVVLDEVSFLSLLFLVANPFHQRVLAPNGPFVDSHFY